MELSHKVVVGNLVCLEGILNLFQVFDVQHRSGIMEIKRFIEFEDSSHYRNNETNRLIEA